MAYQFVPEKKNIEYPERVQQIASEYEAHGFNYTGPTLDDDVESFKEVGFEKRAKARPDSVRMNLLSVYRLIDEYTNDEFMIWKVEKFVRDRDDKDYRIEVVHGRRPKFDVTPLTDDDGNEVDKRIGKWNMVYTTKWDIKLFEELLKESKTKRPRCYIARTSDEYWTIYTGTPIRIKDHNFYKKASYDELLEFDRKLTESNKAKEIVKLK